MSERYSNVSYRRLKTEDRNLDESFRQTDEGSAEVSTKLSHVFLHSQFNEALFYICFCIQFLFCSFVM